MGNMFLCRKIYKYLNRRLLLCLCKENHDMVKVSQQGFVLYFNPYIGKVVLYFLFHTFIVSNFQAKHFYFRGRLDIMLCYNTCMCTLFVIKFD